MGLDTTHDCWHGPYSSFGQWRTTVALAAGIPDTNVSPSGNPSYALDVDAFHEKNFEGEWDEAPSDPLMVLLVHSDCDGIIPTRFCNPLADRLESLMPRIVGDDMDRDLTRQFIAGLRKAAAAGEDVEFH